MKLSRAQFIRGIRVLALGPVLGLTSPRGRLPVAVGGARELWSDGRCTVRDGDRIHLWLEGSWDPKALEHDWDGTPLPSSSVTVDADGRGIMLLLRPPQPSGRFTLAYHDGRRFVLDLMTPGDPPKGDILPGRRALVAATWEAVETFESQDDIVRAEALIEQMRGFPLSLDIALQSELFSLQLARWLGRFDGLQVGLERVIDISRRYGNAPLYATALCERALHLGHIGHFERAAADADLAAAVPGLGLYSDQLQVNVSWVHIHRREYDPDAHDPSAELARAHASLERSESSLAEGARLNLAVAASQGRSPDLAAARRWMDQVDLAALNLRDRVFAHLVLARISHDARVVRSELERAASYAALTFDDDEILRVLYARARFEQESGAPGAALRHYEEAEAIVARQALLLTLEHERSFFAGRDRRSRSHYLSLLDRDPTRAMCMVLGARARHLHSLSVAVDSSPEYVEALTRHREKQGELEAMQRSSRELPQVELEISTRRANLERERLANDLRAARARLSSESPPWMCPIDARGERDVPQGTALLTMHPLPEAGRWWFAWKRYGEQPLPLVIEGAIDAASRWQAAKQVLCTMRDDDHLAGLEQLWVVPTGEFLDVGFHTLLARMWPQGPW